MVMETIKQFADVFIIGSFQKRTFSISHHTATFGLVEPYNVGENVKKYLIFNKACTNILENVAQSATSVNEFR